MKKEKKSENWEEEFDRLFGAKPFCNGAFYQRKKPLTISEVKSFIRQLLKKAYQEGFEAGQHEATPQYKKDMRDAYEKGKRDAIELNLLEKEPTPKQRAEAGEPIVSILEDAVKEKKTIKENERIGNILPVILRHNAFYEEFKKIEYRPILEMIRITLKFI